jgi:hypothetical protein
MGKLRNQDVTKMGNVNKMYIGENYRLQWVGSGK